MKDFKDRVALITGAANGFGKEFVLEAARRGMRIAAVDIEKEQVEAVCEQAREMGAQAIAIHADLTDFDAIEKTVNTVMDTYGQIDLLMNNAGVVIRGTVWDLPLRDWEWITRINMLSHVGFMRLVIPIMLKQKTHCNIVNTASLAGLNTAPEMAAYHATKHAAVALAESVSYDLQAIGADISLSVFCPGYIQTDLHHYERRRPERFSDPTDPYYSSPQYKADQEAIEFYITNGRPIDFVGMRVFQSIEDEEFYILTEPVHKYLIERRVTDMLDGKGPDLYRLRP